MKAVVVGAGRIGCGFVGDILDRSGYDLVFVTRRREHAEHLNRVGSYVVRLASRNDAADHSVAGFRAVACDDRVAVADEIAGADVVATSVGATELAAVAPLIAAGLGRARAPVNVLAFENGLDAAASLRELMGRGATAGHGFASALVSRVVARRIGSIGGDAPLVFVGDPPASVVVDGRRLVAPRPAIRGMIVTDQWAGWVCRKLFLFSAGHVTTAYLGYLKGYHYVHSAIRDPEIRAAVLAAMQEAQAGLARRFGSEVAGTQRDLLETIERFENAALGDPIERVGRDPRRKLAPGERLVGAACAAEEAGVVPANLGLAVAAGLCFCDPEDASSSELDRAIERGGAATLLDSLCGLDPSQGVGRVVAEQWDRALAGFRRGRLLLRLDGHLWA